MSSCLAAGPASHWRRDRWRSCSAPSTSRSPTWRSPTSSAPSPGVSDAITGWIVSGYALAFASTIIVGGRLADRYGRLLVFRAGVLGLVVSSIIAGFAPDVGILLAARAIQGLCGALTVPSSLALVLPQFPAGRQASVIGIWAAAGMVASGIAPGLAAVILEISKLEGRLSGDRPHRGPCVLGLAEIPVRDGQTGPEHTLGSARRVHGHRSGVPDRAGNTAGPSLGLVVHLDTGVLRWGSDPAAALLAAIGLAP